MNDTTERMILLEIYTKIQDTYNPQIQMFDGF